MTVRAYLADVCIDTVTIFGSPLYGTVATIANVAYDRTDLKRSSVIAVYEMKQSARGEPVSPTGASSGRLRSVST